MIIILRRLIIVPYHATQFPLELSQLVNVRGHRVEISNGIVDVWLPVHVLQDFISSTCKSKARVQEKAPYSWQSSFLYYFYTRSIITNFPLIYSILLIIKLETPESTFYLKSTLDFCCVMNDEWTQTRDVAIKKNGVAFYLVVYSEMQRAAGKILSPAARRVLIQQLLRYNTIVYTDNWLCHYLMR